MALHSVSENISKFNVKDDKAYITSKASKKEVENYLNEINLDSLLQRAFSIYKIDLDFTYSLVNNIHKRCKKAEFRCMLNCDDVCDSDLNRRYELRVVFPDKSGYVLRKLGPMLILSISVISIGILGFVFTARALWKQRRYHEMTIDFVNNMTHEFKTPISTITLARNLLLKKINPESGSENEKYLKLIGQENNKLKAQVERILQLSTLERGDYHLNKSPHNINTLIGEVVDKYSLILSEKKGVIQLNLDDTIPLTLLDPIYMKDALSNLIDNAIKYTDQKPEISIKTTSVKDKCIVSISDNGIGMVGEKQKHIFKKFYRIPTGDLHDVKGFGLGLSYVHLIIKAHQGSISVESTVGKGSKFIIELATI